MRSGASSPSSVAGAASWMRAPAAAAAEETVNRHDDDDDGRTLCKVVCVCVFLLVGFCPRVGACF